MIPLATYRLQLNKGFTFADAEALIPYLADLGISHLYASPITTARPGSLHGYDVIDPTRVNPELGGEEGLRRLADALGQRRMGLIVDIVPNHMAATLENPWWADVLRHGQASRHARTFDIDWESEDPELGGKVFLPVLGEPLHQANLAVEQHDGAPHLRYRDLLLPMNGHDPDRQFYRLGWWRSAGDRINWRRFFDINELVCLRMEDDAVFEEVHAMILRLAAEGVIDGLRVDHVDGLADPAGYCAKLRHRLGPDAYLVVEKILLSGESLPGEWQCHGTTGYDFMDQVSALQHDASGAKPLADLWHRLSGRWPDFAAEEQAARREIIARSFSSQLEACVAAVAREARDLGRPIIRRGLTELLVHFPVYRTYRGSGRRFLDMAVAGARTTALPADHWALDAIADHVEDLPRFQQLSAPIAAKAVEDTAFYRYGRLLSRNDVGFDASRFTSSVPEFHVQMVERWAALPHAQLTTATHDHKRGEDVRARLAVLSELPGEWADRVTRWIGDSGKLRSNGHPVDADVAQLLQMIVGAWPLDLGRFDAAGRIAFAKRLAGWQEKALREAKLRSDWALPDEIYEAASRRFVLQLVGDDRLPDLLSDIFAFVDRIAVAGASNGLAQLLLKLTAPGVPDFYQGTEYWDFSLVDPDNRQPVDFQRRQASLTGPSSGFAHWRTGAVKQTVIRQALALRRLLPSLFAAGSYEPLEVQGTRADDVVAFQRRHDGESVVAVVPRRPATALAAGWGDTVVRLPADRPLANVLDGSAPFAGDVAVHALTTNLPVALLSTRTP